MNSVKLLSADKLFKMLLRSVKNRIVEVIEFSGCSDEPVLSQFGGSSNEAPLRQCFEILRS